MTQDDPAGPRRFEFQKQCYTLHDGSFRAPSFPDQLPLEEYLARVTGLSKGDAEGKLQDYGLNTFDVPIPSFGELFRAHAVASGSIWWAHW